MIKDTKNWQPFIALLILGFVSWNCTSVVKAQTNPSIQFESLTCNNDINPIAIETEQPLFSWIINSTGYNRSQSAYQVIVASNPELLNDMEADIWNSKKVFISNSTHINYRGKSLKAMKKYWWKVRIWDEKGKVTSWSDAQIFEMGLMNESNWANAKWIGLNKDTRTSEHRFREYKTSKMETSSMVTSQATAYLRSGFNTRKQVVSARAYICGLGYYELSINGKKTGDHELDPAPSNYDKLAYYVSYDVSDQIENGKNSIGITLGNGFYGQNISWKNDPESEKDLSYGIPAVRLLIKVKYIDGSEEEIITDENWKEATGPIVFDNIYGGDTYDARYEIEGWNTADFDDSKWGNVNVISPDVEKIVAQQIPPIRKLKELAPQRVFKSVKGNWIVDFGQNIAGWVRINVQEKKGQVIQIIPTEALIQDGNDIYPGSTGGGANGMKQLLKYICKGSGIETWEPKFSYHGFRYVEMTGVSSKPDINSIKAILVANDIEEQGSFTCSDPLYNKMHSISKWTIVDNLHGIPEDCPHREKCGWLGDAHAFCEYALYNYDMENFYKKYMEDIRTQMRPIEGNDDSNVKYNVPTMIAPGKRTSTIAKLDWGIATMYLPWYNYLYYGDTTIVREYYDEMKGLTNYYLSFMDDTGIIDNGMGDWCPPRWDRRKNPSAMECDPVVSANAYFFDILGIMERFADLNQDQSYREMMKKEKKALQIAFNKEFLTPIPKTSHHWYGSQTATVMALQFEMVPDDKLESVLDGLEYDIRQVKGGHHSTGIHGNRYIYTVLTKYGRSDLAHDILVTPDFPSQTYVMNYGFTTWPERQFEWAEVEALTNSLNHPMHSGFAAYFFESLAGIKPLQEAPGFREFRVDPKFPKSITQAEVEIPTPYGSIENSWELNKNEFTMKLMVPFNTKARIELTKSELESLSVNGDSWIDFEKMGGAQIVDDSTILLGSGDYSIEYIKEEI